MNIVIGEIQKLNDEDTRENINGKGKFIIKREDDNKILYSQESFYFF